MALFEFTGANLQNISETTFHEAAIRERQDLQACLRDHVHVIAKDCLVISEEFGNWEDSRRRIDLLALDKDANLVVIELKRTEDGGHMELQAIRYAAMVSSMTFDQVVETYSAYIERRGLDVESAHEAILSHLEWEEPLLDEFAQSVRIILCSAEFSREITTAVLWLNMNGLDITCLRLRPYRLEERILLNIEQIIPLPEAGDYQVRVREKVQQERQARRQDRDLRRFTLSYGRQEFTNQPKRRLIWHTCNAVLQSGADPHDLVRVLEGPKRILVYPGSLTAMEVLERARQEHGRSYPKYQWFIGDEEMWQLAGVTVLLLKAWSTRTEFWLEKILQHWPELDFSYEVDD